MAFFTAWSASTEGPRIGSLCTGTGMLDQAVMDIFKRWHRAFRPVPWPVDDRGRLNPELSEWMMGYPAGWVTAVPAPDGMKPSGLRNAQLKAIGNGVVRQQMVYGIRIAFQRAFGHDPMKWGMAA